MREAVIRFVRHVVGGLDDAEKAIDVSESLGPAARKAQEAFTASVLQLLLRSPTAVARPEIHAVLLNTLDRDGGRPTRVARRLLMSNAAPLIRSNQKIERKLTEIVEALGDDALLTRLLIARAEAVDANPSELAARAMTSLKRLEPLARAIVLQTVGPLLRSMPRKVGLRGGCFTHSRRGGNSSVAFPVGWTSAMATGSVGILVDVFGEIPIDERFAALQEDFPYIMQAAGSVGTSLLDLLGRSVSGDEDPSLLLARAASVTGGSTREDARAEDHATRTSARCECNCTWSSAAIWQEDTFMVDQAPLGRQ